MTASKPLEDAIPTPTPRETVSNQTRDRLMREAITLLSREGLRGVSLRRIVTAAGASNPSALHYHFGSREALIEEITRSLQAWLEPRCLAGLAPLEARLESGDYSVRDVLEALFRPIMQMLTEPGYGMDAIRFIARLGWDFGPKGQELSAQMHAESLNRGYRLLQRLLPDLPGETLKFRLLLNMNNVYYGLAYRSYLWRSPFGAMDIAAPERGPELERLFMDYLVAGIRG